MLIYDQRNFDLHLTQLNCAIANWATIIRIIYRPTQMLLAFATANLNPCIGRREVLINHQSDRINKQISSLHVPGILIKLQTEITAVLWQWNKFQSPTGLPLICIHTKSSASAFRLTVFPRIAHSTNFKPSTAFTCAELQFFASAKVWNNAGLSNQRYLTVRFYRFWSTHFVNPVSPFQIRMKPWLTNANITLDNLLGW